MINRLCTDDEIAHMLHAFYASVREDEGRGPVCDQHIDDWDLHLAQLVDFWSSILLRTGRYAGTPMSKHIALPDLSAELFQRWQALFHETTAAQPNQAMGKKACAMAQHIAHSLWLGYQTARTPDALPTKLEPG